MLTGLIGKIKFALGIGKNKRKKMKVHVYAVLKDYFETEFDLDHQVGTIKELNDVLLQRNPVAGNVLDTCRFAVNDTFVDHHFQLHNNDIISIIPPSSGG